MDAMNLAAQLATESPEPENNALPLIILVVLAGALVFWVLRRFMPSMPLTRRVLWIAVGAVVLGGFFYGFVYSR